MSKFKYINQKDQIISWFQEGKQYVEIAKLLNSKDIQNDTQNIRRLIINVLGKVQNNRKVIMTSKIQSKVLQYLKENKTVPEIANILGIFKAPFPNSSSCIRLIDVNSN